MILRPARVEQMRKAFDETKHPRDPGGEGGGQFTSGAGSGGAPAATPPPAPAATKPKPKAPDAKKPAVDEQTFSPGDTSSGGSAAAGGDGEGVVRPTGGTTTGPGSRPGSKPVEERDLLGIGGDTKTKKGEEHKVATGIMYLAPADESGIANLCPFASPDCKADCLKSSGRMIMDNAKNARMWKTQAMKDDPKGFVDRLETEVKSLVKATDKGTGRGKYMGFKPAVRLNGTSDIPWENMKGTDGKNLMEKFPDVQFYDYTKNPKRMASYSGGDFPKNYHLTFSRSELNDPNSKLFNPKFGNIDDVLKSGKGNVAVVFDTPTTKVKGTKTYANALPETFNGYPVIDGDQTDLRFLDPDGGHVIGLRGKGSAQHAESSASDFVYPTQHTGLKIKKPKKDVVGPTIAETYDPENPRVLNEAPELVAASDRWLPMEDIYGDEGE